ncbi:MAG: type IV toxin-antitoxin system AbiEi family antitoxin [Bacteroidales bacterium]|nr:type IV toxin-antitoxin system AbiEi family antitoxin [Bacteroidales bacterium]
MKEKIKISDWINQQLARGEYTFTLAYLQANKPEKSDISIKLALKRLVDKNKIISVNKGFYIIIPPAYSNLGFLPLTMFMDDLMEYLGRPYYISLLSAAALHGAAHQQPQVNFVCTSLPSMRTTTKKGVQIKYVSKRSFPESHIIQKKSESGYVNLSDPLLTCLDLISYYKTVGGFNRVATVINELSEEIGTDEIKSSILQWVPDANIQRLGYLWEYECGQAGLADALFRIIKVSSNSLKTYKLSSSKNLQKEKVKNRWKINVNIKIEIDE